MRIRTRTDSLVASLGLMLLSCAAAAVEPEVDWRWIGIKSSPEAGCPSYPGLHWDVERLFPSADGGELARFCLYTRDVPAPVSELEVLELQALDRDLMAVGRHGSELAELTWEPLQEHFLSQAGQTALPGGALEAVRLAVIDSSPTGEALGSNGPEDVAANSPHGPAILNIARDLICDPTETLCQARLTSRLGLAYECFDAVTPGDCRNDTEGGFLGLVSEIAQAVASEVQAFESEPNERRLVINLSVGWDAAYGGTQTQVADMPAPVQAVYRALEYARCKGALVLAAAGNRGASPEPQMGPVMPALWETRRTPSSQRCIASGVPQPAPGLDGPAIYRPLIFSAGGVTADGGLLDNARVEGAPRLAAFADHAVVALSGTGEPSGTLTGTSVSTVVVSATAAALWSYFPHLDAFQVMAAIYNAGAPLGRNASYCLGGSPCLSEQVQVNLCEALSKACTDFPGVCSVSCQPPAKLSFAEVDFSSFENAPEVEEFDLNLLDAQLPSTSLCGNERLRYYSLATPPVDRCPHRQFSGSVTRPWAEPQPEIIPCPPCFGTFESPGTLYFEVEDTWDGDLSSGTLKCGNSTYALDLQVLAAGDKAIIRNVPTNCLTSFPTILSFTVDQDRATVIPLRLCQDCT